MSKDLAKRLAAQVQVVRDGCEHAARTRVTRALGSTLSRRVHSVGRSHRHAAGGRSGAESA
eukprot:CAMPEP_0197602622 /NCGR_PEP_ID=MMETSP1326-20131121/37615_1 /TAXON_ID=1155430 /ORGANISM="Genus nov. species nov., Strain RCC2288" /LENGTH=60 /DNA_ID=CAMNT_0043170017 /DNA_START=162 /DNA_END=341 /DNA_ORIENTATION=+